MSEQVRCFKLLTEDIIRGELTGNSGPCVSLYQATHRHHPENQQDPIRFRNLLKSLQASLEQSVSSAEAQALLAPMQKLAEDAEVWNHTLDGLAVFSAPGVFKALRLPTHVAELTVVADSFHVKPLKRYFQSTGRYQVLALSLGKVRVFEGNRHHLDELDLEGRVPEDLPAALGTELTEKHQTVTSHGGVGLGSSMRHGHGGKADEVDNDRERFFRAVDRAVSEHVSKPSGLPLLLCCLPEYQGHFRALSQNSLLVAPGLSIDPESLAHKDLEARAWEAFAPAYTASLAEYAENFGNAQAQGNGISDLAEAARAGVEGRIGTLLLESGRAYPGRLDHSTGAISLAPLDAPDVDDLLDDLGEVVSAKGGRVVVLPPGAMPTKTGLAATLRY